MADQLTLERSAKITAILLQDKEGWSEKTIDDLLLCISQKFGWDVNKVGLRKLCRSVDIKLKPKTSKGGEGPLAVVVRKQKILADTMRTLMNDLGIDEPDEFREVFG